MNWIKQFTDMISLPNQKQPNIEEAYQLKNKHLPKSIFKYRAVNENSIKNLQEDTVWLADPSNFNDPYDCAHTADVSTLQKKAEPELFAKYIENRGREINLSDEQKTNLYKSKEPINDLIDILLSNESPSNQKLMKERLIAVQLKLQEYSAIATSKAIASSFKLCSFSERNDSILMWAHYAQYHQGFCIEYDLKSIPCYDYRRLLLFPVIYSDEIFNATEYLMKTIESEPFGILPLSLSALIKAKDWKYEKEWRLIFYHGIIDKEQTYYMGKPKEIYLGARISKDNQELLAEICEKRNISIRKMKIHHNKFMLEPVPLKIADEY